MLEIRSKLKVARAAYAIKIAARLALTFDARQKTRLRAALDNAEPVALLLPRGETLRGGDLLVASDGRVIELIALPEAVVRVACDTPRELARAAYHLGNRHIPVEVGEGWLRIAEDHVLEQMLLGLGASLTREQAPFEPEAGAYGGHGHHQQEAREHAGRIHEYGAQGDGHDAHHHDHTHCNHAHDHAQEHTHDHAHCGHTHSHDHHDHAHSEHDHHHNHDHAHTHSHGHAHSHKSSK